MGNQKMRRDSKPSGPTKKGRAADMPVAEREAIDAAFQGMAGDEAYQREALLIAEEFAASDAEAIELSERDSIRA